MYIHFSNLNKQTTVADIYALLSEFTSTGYCTIRHIKNGFTSQTSTFALVELNNPIEIKHIIELLNGSMFGGRRIIVQMGK